MGIRRTIFAALYDRQMKSTERKGLGAMRRRLLTRAEGRVVEIGGGTGVNLGIYGPEVTALTVTEPQPAMLKRLRAHAAQRAPLATVVQASAEELPFEDGSFDVAVSTLVLCGVDDPSRALGQLARVLRPGGRLLFLEHVRSDEPKVARWQDRMNPVNRAVVCCDCNRDTLAAIEKAGFLVDEVERGELPGAPSFVRPLIIGSASLPVAAG